MATIGIHLWYDTILDKFYYKDQFGVTQEFIGSGGGGPSGPLYSTDILDFTPAALAVAKTAPKVILMACNPSAAVRDLVYQDTSVDMKAIVASNNTATEPVIGIILDKPSSTTANVLILGIVSGYSGLTRGSKLFLGIGGTFTHAAPTSGYVQPLGVALSSTQVLFIPSIHRTKRI